VTRTGGDQKDIFSESDRLTEVGWLRQSRNLASGIACSKDQGWDKFASGVSTIHET
jgi:hypothetical protein